MLSFLVRADFDLAIEGWVSQSRQLSLVKTGELNRLQENPGLGHACGSPCRAKMEIFRTRQSILGRRVTPEEPPPGSLSLPQSPFHGISCCRLLQGSDNTPSALRRCSSRSTLESRSSEQLTQAIGKNIH